MAKEEAEKEAHESELKRPRYNKTQQAHPDDAHTESKRFFKRKGRKRQRQKVNKKLEDIKHLYNNN